MTEAIYLIQIVCLAACIFMVLRARKAIGGMARGLVLLLALLIVRRLDDAFGILDSTGTLILSSLVVASVTYDVWLMYKDRKIFEAYLRTRQARIAELESKRSRSELRDGSWDHQHWMS